MMMYSGKSVIENLDSELIRKLYQDGRSKADLILGDNRPKNHYYDTCSIVNKVTHNLSFV